MSDVSSPSQWDNDLHASISRGLHHRRAVMKTRLDCSNLVRLFVVNVWIHHFHMDCGSMLAPIFFHSEDNVSYGLCTSSPLEFRSRGDKSYWRVWAEGMHAAWILSAVLGGLFQPSTESSGSGVRATLPSSLPIPLCSSIFDATPKWYCL